MILIDTSAWVEFLRDTGSVISARVDAELDGDIAICDAIAPSDVGDVSAGKVGVYQDGAAAAAVTCRRVMRRPLGRMPLVTGAAAADPPFAGGRQ